MAHRSNVVQVFEDVIKSENESEQVPELVVDPVCGRELRRSECRFMMFRQEQTHYFCSKACQVKFHPALRLVGG